MSEPVSVVMPVKNGARYIHESIASIMACTTPFDEVIIIDDGSDDETHRLLQGYLTQFSNLRVEMSPGVGIVEALNYGIEISKNEWIARFDVDDHYGANRLFEQRKLIAPGVAVIFSDYCFKDSKGNKLGIVPSAISPEATALSLVNSFRTAHPSALLYRPIFTKSGKYQKTDFPAEDLGLWLRMLRHGTLISAPKVLLFYSLSSGSVSSEYRSVMIHRRLELLSKYGIPGKDIEYVWRNWKKITSSYKNFPFSSKRKILLCRDLISATSLFGGRIEQIAALFIAFRLFLNPINFMSLILLIFEKKKRDSTRVSQK